METGDELHPVAETQEAFGLLRTWDDDTLEQTVAQIGRRVREISPECIALSLTLRRSGLTFTLVAENRTSALMDAVQYLDGGPCVETTHREDPLRLDLTPRLATDEHHWQLFARAGSRQDIAATLSMPVPVDEEVVAVVNLYGRTTDAFDGRLEQLAAVCGAWARDAVTNADLGFESRVLAAAAPDRILDNQDVQLATGIVASLQHIDADEAESRLRSAATRAGVSAPEFARFVLASHQRATEARSAD